MRTRISTAVVVGVLAVTMTPVQAQQADEIAAAELKYARIVAAGPPEVRFRGRGLVWPTERTADQEYFGFRIIVGGEYEPTAFPDETWIDVACLAQDPRVPFDSEKHGTGLVSYLVRVHALIYEIDTDGSLNTDTAISTASTTDLDEGICNLSHGVDTTFIEIPRTFDAAAISVFAVAREGQYVEVVENVERLLLVKP